LEQQHVVVPIDRCTVNTAVAVPGCDFTENALTSKRLVLLKATAERKKIGNSGLEINSWHSKWSLGYKHFDVVGNSPDMPGTRRITWRREYRKIF